MNGACISDALNTPGYEERLGCHTGAAEPGGVPVALRFYTDDDDDLEPALRRARGVFAHAGFQPAPPCEEPPP